MLPTDMPPANCLPTPLASCTVSWRDPATVEPAGRLQGDVVLDQLGGLTARCQNPGDPPLLGPDGLPLRGVGLNIAGHATNQQTADEDPPAGYENPIRVTVDGAVWIQPAAPVFQPAVSRTNVVGLNMVGPTNGNRVDLHSPIRQCVRNPTDDVGIVRRRVSVVSWSMDDPPPPDGPTVPIPFTSLLDNSTVVTELLDRTVGADPLQVLDGTAEGNVSNPQSSGTLHFPPQTATRYTRAKIDYWLDVTGAGRVLVGQVRSGGSTGGTMTYDLPDAAIGPGECWCETVQPYIQAIIPAGTIPWLVYPGEIVLTHTLVVPPPGQSFTYTEVCTP